MNTPAPIPGILVAGHFDVEFGYAGHRRAGTSDWLIAYTLAGGGLYRSGRELVTTRVGDVTLLPPTVPHDYRAPRNGRWEFVWAHFLPRPGWTRWLQLPAVHGGLHCFSIHTPGSQHRIAAAFQRLIADSRIGGGLSAVDQELALNALEEVLLICAREMDTEHTRGLDPRIEHVLDVLSRRMATSQTVADLAADVALSPSRLAHLFKAQTGASIVETLTTIRLEQAARLLAQTTHSISEISTQVGFRSAFYFSSRFRQRFGHSPSAYRLIVTHR